MNGRKCTLKSSKKPSLRLLDVISDIVKLSKVKAATQFFLLAFIRMAKLIGLFDFFEFKTFGLSALF